MDDLRHLHEADQRHEQAKALGRDVAAYYRSLVDGGVPDTTAHALTMDMQDLWIGSALMRDGEPVEWEGDE